MQYPYVSIIIPTFNEEKYIRKCLESILKLSYPKDRYEIIVVDNGSTDKTVSICREYTRSIYIRPKINVSELRNYGAMRAIGNIYAFIDGDCTAEKDWLDNAVKSIEIEKCVTGASCSIPSEATWVEKAWGSEILYGRREKTHIASANLIVPADIFNEIGGFDAKLKSGEDYEFSMRAKSITKIISDDRIKVTHYGNPKTIRQFIKREIWHGLGAFGSLKTQLIDKPLIGTLLFSFLSLLQLISFINVLSGGKRFLFYYSTAGIIALLTATVYYKKRYIKNIKHAFSLLLLYYIYYISRSISLFYIIFNLEYKRKR